MNIPDSVEIEWGSQPRSSVIWLHGLGADGHDFEPIVPQLELAREPGVRFVFPHAPLRSVTINGGMTMRAWYDIRSFDREGPQDEAGIRESAILLGQLIERERGRGSDYSRIVVAGFSQGGAIALHTALRFPHRLAGVMGLSTWLPLAATLEAEVVSHEREVPRDLPVFLAHGSFDPMLPLALGLHSRQLLEGAGFQVEWHEYPMAHNVCPEEIIAIRDWLARVLPAPE